MGSVRIDSQLYGMPEWRAASKGARALWTTAASWSSMYSTVGHVPDNALRALDGTRREAAELVRVGLWHVAADGWVFQGWEAVAGPGGGA